MSNEQILEELLTEAHNSGFCPEIFEIVKTKYSDLERLDAYQNAFIDLQTKYEIIDMNYTTTKDRCVSEP